MTLVLDASAALAMALETPGNRSFDDILSEAGRVLAPKLFVSETTHALWKYVRFGNLRLDAAERALEKCLGWPDEYADDLDLSRESLALAVTTGKPAYDMFYLVLARRNAATLVTADKELAALALKQNVKLFRGH